MKERWPRIEVPKMDAVEARPRREGMDALRDLAKDFRRAQTDEERDRLLDEAGPLVALGDGLFYRGEPIGKMSVEETVSLLALIDRARTHNVENGVRISGSDDDWRVSYVCEEIADLQRNVLVHRFVYALGVRGADADVQRAQEEYSPEEKQRVVAQYAQFLEEGDDTGSLDDAFEGIFSSDAFLPERDRLAQRFLRKKHHEEGLDFADELPEDAIASPIAPSMYGVFDAHGRLQEVRTERGDALAFAEAIRLVPRKNASARERERQEAIVRDIETLMDLRFRDLIEQDYGIRLNELTLREQIWFQSLLRNMETAESKDVYTPGVLELEREGILSREEILDLVDRLRNFDEDVDPEDLRGYTPERLLGTMYELYHEGDQFIGTGKRIWPGGYSNEELQLTSFTKRYGIEGARTFLAAEMDDSYKDDILLIGEKVDTSLAQEVFARYSEIAIAAQAEAEQLVNEFFEDGVENEVQISAIESELLKKAAGMLREVAESVRRGEEVNEQTLLKKLERYKKDVVVFSSIFRAAFKEGEHSLEDVRGLELDSMHPEEISEAEKGEMRAIFDENWQAQRPDLADKLGKQFGEILERTGDATSFFVLKKDHRVVAFVRFDKRTDIAPNAVYGGSLNVDPSMRGAAIGEALMHATIDRVAEKHVIYADVFPELAVGTKYVEDLGCNIIGIQEVRVDGGERVLKRFLLKRDNAENERAAARNTDDLDRLVHVGRVKKMTFDVRNGTQEMVDAVEAAKNGGMVITRYFADRENPHLRTMIAEPVVSSAQ